MQQFHLNGGTNQQWAFVPLSDGNYLIVNQKSGKALDIGMVRKTTGPQSSNGTWTGSPARSGRLIQLSDGNYVILNANSGKALEIAANHERRGRNRPVGYGGAPNQEWRLEQA